MRRLDVGRLAGAVDDGGVLFLDDDLLRLAEIVQRRLLERQTDFIGDDRAARQGRNVLQHRLAAIAEARRLDGGDLEDAADVVDDERRERLALDVFGDDQQRAGPPSPRLRAAGSISRMLEIFLSHRRITASQARPSDSPAS